MVTIEWINHASFRLEHGPVKLIVDPWFEGAVFNSSWSLVAPTVFSYERFRDATHIWISHEHPDHFSPGTLKRIPHDARNSLEVLYQWTRDKRVIDHCRRLGFRCVEVPTLQSQRISPDVRLMSGTVESDSWLYVNAGACTLLNLNDCVLSDASAVKAIAERCGPIDVLFTQFSYAIWSGNPEDVAKRRKAAQAKIDSLLLQVECLRPKYVVPCASFIWFSHAENAYMNDAVNDIGAIRDIVAGAGATPVILYPGDSWKVGQSHDSEHAVARYRADWAAARTAPRNQGKVVPLEELVASGRDFVARLRSRNSLLWMLRPLAWAGLLRPVHILLSDLQRVVRFDIYQGLNPVVDKQPDVSMSSDALSFCLRFDFGFDTTMIAGRFKELRPGARFLMSRQFALARRNNDGLYFPSLIWRSNYGARKIKAFLAAR